MNQPNLGNQTTQQFNPNNGNPRLGAPQQNNSFGTRSRSNRH